MTAPSRAATSAGTPPSGVILVVDDQPANRLLIRHLFDELGYRVLEAENGVAGLALARAERPDCILLDLHMPELGGFAVLDALERDPRTRETPVIILTATDDTLDGMERALRGGAVDYITKPISPRRVAIRVQGAIERRRLLAELNALRQSFTSMIVHDLRAPLTVIKGYADLLGHTGGSALSERQQKHVRGMQEACARMMRLIGEVLDLSKLEAGKLGLERRPLEFGALVADIVERLEPLAAKQEVDLEVRPPGRDLYVSADPDRIEQILMNLLGNALKFTPAGGAITVSLDGTEAAVEVTVTDTGPGIQPEELPLLFEPFGQTSSARAAMGPGTGLGLVICRHLVEAHGGQIRADSQPGHGASFVFTLPTARSA